tara:strand:+ start:341 stop:583 length:243 start_codon:yes stop_codon:yes gene_type:complete
MKKKDWEGFTGTICEVLKYDFREAIKNRSETRGTDKEDFYAGYLAAFHHLFTLLEERTGVAEITMADLSLDEFNEEDFLK